MKWLLLVLTTLLFLTGGSCITKDTDSSQDEKSPTLTLVELPQPRLSSGFSLEKALSQRRSVRHYTGGPLNLTEVSQLLWAAQGKTIEWGGRTAPSAGALYPLEVYLSAGNVEDLAPGVYRYDPERHTLTLVRAGDVRDDLGKACLGQRWVSEASINIIISANYQRTTLKYGDRGIRYVHLEAGHAAQNVCLQTTALGLGTVPVGAFDDERVKEIIGLPYNESPLYVLPVGRTG